MSTDTLPAPSRALNPWIPACAYGLITLLYLWGCGGGSWSVALPRVAPAGFAALALAYAFLHFAGRATDLRVRPGLNLAAAAGLVAFLPVLVLVYLVRHGGLFWQPDLPRPGLLPILAAACLLAPSQEILGRGLLQPAWGLGSVAFLDALTFGFGTQNFAVFLGTWGMSYVGGILRHRFGLAAAITARSVWTLLVFLSLGWI